MLHPFASPYTPLHPLLTHPNTPLQVEQGTVKPGDKLWVMPNRVPVEVLNVWLDQDEVPPLHPPLLPLSPPAPFSPTPYPRSTPSPLLPLEPHGNTATGRRQLHCRTPAES